MTTLDVQSLTTETTLSNIELITNVKEAVKESTIFDQITKSKILAFIGAIDVIEERINNYADLIEYLTKSETQEWIRQLIGLIQDLPK
ncbi:MAG: hypothetical protein Q8L15_02300 [Methylobacter sp.]|nr:hypothetical protein [Methylobacter sp.]